MTHQHPYVTQRLAEIRVDELRASAERRRLRFASRRPSAATLTDGLRLGTGRLLVRAGNSLLAPRLDDCCK